MPDEVLSRRALNRALLARQLLLDRPALPAAGPGRAARVVHVIEHLVGLQAQAPFPPYYGLLSRLDGFRPDDLAELLTSRAVVRIALMRGTIHLVSAADCLPLRRLVQPVIERGTLHSHGRYLTGVDTAALAAAGRALVEAEPMTFRQLGHALAERWPDHPPDALAQGVRAFVPLVQVPPRAAETESFPGRCSSTGSWSACGVPSGPQGGTQRQLLAGPRSPSRCSAPPMTATRSCAPPSAPRPTGSVTWVTVGSLRTV